MFYYFNFIFSYLFLFAWFFFYLFVCLFVFMLWQDSNRPMHYSSASPVKTAPVPLHSSIPVVVLSKYDNIHHPHFCPLSKSHSRVITMCQSCFSVPVSTESLLDQCDNTPRHLTKCNFTLIECYQWLMRCLSLVLTPPVYPSFIPHFFSSPIGTCHCGSEHGWMHVIIYQLWHWKAFTNDQCYWSNMHGISTSSCFSNLMTISYCMSLFCFQMWPASRWEWRICEKSHWNRYLEKVGMISPFKGLSIECVSLVQLII